MKINHSAQIDITPTTTFGDIVDAIEGADIPRSASVTIDKRDGGVDQRDRGRSTMNFGWTTETA